MNDYVTAGDLVRIDGTFSARYVDPTTGCFHDGKACFRADVALEVVRVRYPYGTVVPSSRGYTGVKYLIDPRETQPRQFKVEA